MRALLCIACILVSSLVSNVKCEENTGGSLQNLWQRLKEAVKKFFGDLRAAWGEMKTEMEERTRDISSWTRDAFNDFKKKMNEWIEERTDIGSAEKSDMRNFIERLEMEKSE